MTRVLPNLSQWPQQPPLKCCPPAYFLFHVPKCAGRTIDRHLARYAANSYYRTRKRKGISRLLLPRHQITDMPAASGIAVIGGHYLGTSLEDFFPNREIRRVLLLRDPVSHAVSYYNFRMSRYIRQGLAPYSFETAYGAAQRNFITHFILRNFLELPWPRLLVMGETEKWRRVTRFLGTFWFVGDYRRCSELISAMAPNLGVPCWAVPQNQSHGHASDVWQPLRVSDLSPETIGKIQRENRLDLLLWQTWRNAGYEPSRIAAESLPRPETFNPVGHEVLRAFYEMRRRIARLRPQARALADFAEEA